MKLIFIGEDKVVNKYDKKKKIQEDMLNNRFGKDGTGEWCHISANVLEGRIRNYYTNNLDSYHFRQNRSVDSPQLNQF